jgi:antitoxin (DNA-binding transcriptional repressor) of toxin-antitoxin stability system
MASIVGYMESGSGRTTPVGIAELKNRLSYYLRRVRRGEAILVCDRDRVIARIERVEPHARVDESQAAWLDRLERRGVIRRGVGKLNRQWLAQRPAVQADVVAALLQEREEGP